MTHVQAEGGRPDQRPRNRRRGDDGVALVEFAIIAPLVFALLVGLFTGGVALSQRNSMTNAVREGTRVGATLSESGSWADTVRTRVLDLAGDDLTASDICVRLVKAPSTVKQESAGCSGELLSHAPSIASIPANECVVVVMAHRDSEMQAVFFSRNLHLVAKSAGRYERECT